MHFYGGNRRPRLHHEGLGATAVRRRPWCRWCCTRLATWPPIFVVLYLLVPQKTKSSLLVILYFHGGDRHPRLRTYTIEGVTLSRAYIVPRDGALQGTLFSRVNTLGICRVFVKSVHNKAHERGRDRRNLVTCLSLQYLRYGRFDRCLYSEVPVIRSSHVRFVMCVGVFPVWRSCMYIAHECFHRQSQGRFHQANGLPRVPSTVANTVLFSRPLRGSSSPLEQKLAHDRFAALYPGDQNAAKSAFLAFAGMLGQVRYRAQRFRTAGLWWILSGHEAATDGPLGRAS